MKKIIITSVLLTSLAVLSLISFYKTKTPLQPKQKPVAEAGDWLQEILLPLDSVELRGIGTDADGYIVDYLWRVRWFSAQAGQYVTDSFNTADIMLRNLKEGRYLCGLRVTDNDGLIDWDDLEVRVIGSGCPCVPDPCDNLGDPCNKWDY